MSGLSSRVNSYENKLGGRGLDPLQQTQGSNDNIMKMKSVVDGTDIIFKKQMLTSQEARELKIFGTNTRAQSQLRPESVADIYASIKAEKQNRYPVYGVRIKGSIYLLTGSRRCFAVSLIDDAMLFAYITDQELKPKDIDEMCDIGDRYLEKGFADSVLSILAIKNSEDNDDPLNLKELKDYELAERLKLSKTEFSYQKKWAPLVLSCIDLFPNASLVPREFFKNLSNLQKEGVNLAALISDNIEQIKLSTSKHYNPDLDANIDEMDIDQIKESTNKIRALIISEAKKLIKKNLPTEHNNDADFDFFTVDRKGVTAKRDKKGNLTLKINFDTQTNDVMALVKQIASSQS